MNVSITVQEAINQFDAINEFVKKTSLASTLSRQLRSLIGLHLIGLRNIIPVMLFLIQEQKRDIGISNEYVTNM